MNNLPALSLLEAKELPENNNSDRMKVGEVTELTLIPDDGRRSVRSRIYIRKVRGGSQSHLMLGDDARLWVVKFQNNPQHTRILANEMIVNRIAKIIGLPVPDCEVVAVHRRLVLSTPKMLTLRGTKAVPCSAGRHYGSEYVGGLMPENVVDYLPESYLRRVKNLSTFPGMLCLDKWTGNCDGRQAVFKRDVPGGRHTAYFIDHGFCFNAHEWNFPDTPLRGVYARNCVYEGVTGWESFEPWLGRIEAFTFEQLSEIADMIPPEWYDGDVYLLEALIVKLIERRSRLRGLIEDFRYSDRQPFPNWIG